jgi:hypothetical protein
MGRRYWTVWNTIDFLVVWLSALLMLIKALPQLNQCRS